MRQGQFELLVLRSDGTTIAEEELDGKRFIAAEPNTEYKVKVIAHPDANGNLPYVRQRASLLIDGRDVNYTYVLFGSAPMKTFRGFRTGTHACQAFQFTAAVVSDNNAQGTAPARSAGSIRLTIHEVVLTTTVRGVPHYPPVPEAENQVEGKKFWQQPSLQTALGRTVPAPVVSSAPFKHQNMRTTPDAVLEIHYHTADMVNFLKGMHAPKLQPVVAPPVHVDLSTEVELPVQAPLPPVTVDLTQNAGRTAGRKVKLESQDRSSSGAEKRARSTSSSGGAVEIVDLT